MEVDALLSPSTKRAIRVRGWFIQQKRPFFPLSQRGGEFLVILLRMKKSCNYTAKSKRALPDKKFLSSVVNLLVLVSPTR